MGCLESIEKNPSMEILGKVKNTWQDVKGILRFFDERIGVARRSYRAFVQKGIAQGKRKDLTGGGLKLKISLSGIALSVQRGEKIVQDYGYALIDHQTG